MRSGKVTPRLRSALADPHAPWSLAGRQRALRWRMLLDHFPGLGAMRVLDLGGRVHDWSSSPVQPRSVLVVNLEEQEQASPTLTAAVGDACDPPPLVRESEFDLVYSNSLLEHVGGHHRRQALAGVVHVSAPRHWIQTPYRYFPVEPHWLFPGFQFLPVAARVRAARHWPLAWSRPAGISEVENVLGVELVSKTELQHYFPRSAVIAETFLGVTKSIIAVAGDGVEDRWGASRRPR